MNVGNKEQNPYAQKSVHRKKVVVTGQVQGVGFRPFVYRIAKERELTGHVSNTSLGVEIEIQGTEWATQSFLYALKHELPPLAFLQACTVEDIIAYENEKDFTINVSSGGGGHNVLISADVGLCADCLEDIHTKGGRRHNYAFTNCTNCGPRYTITKSIPYDRGTTSMACFALCAACAVEYADPSDRRFHAQPNACPLCGPKIWCVDTLHNTFDHTDYAHAKEQMQQEQAIKYVAQSLCDGRIVAVKGLGGFHLCCDATNGQAIEFLRQKKNRPHKPLAIMVPHVQAAKKIVHMSDAEEALLTSSEKPIVLLHRKDGDALPTNIAPHADSIGIMLPYTPLHAVLFAFYEKLLPEGFLPALVMTSGNAGGEPICLGNREALQRLGGMSEVFLLHDRDILVRVDDSVIMFLQDAHVPQALPQEFMFLRRARGYVPRPVHFPVGAHKGNKKTHSVLGMGAELKSSLCLTRDATAFVSQHIGDLENAETLEFYQEVAKHLEMLLQVEPTLLVHDKHPNFLSSQKAQEWSEMRGIQSLSLQHHVAHSYAVLAENDYNSHLGENDNRVLGLSLDGMGLGDDGNLWGGELLGIDLKTLSYARLGHLSNFSLPGGDVAVREPWRLALSLAYGQEDISIFENVPEAAQYAVREMLKKQINCPKTTSCGRLFDAVSAGLSLCHRVSYEGQAAIMLEHAQKKYVCSAHDFARLGMDCSFLVQQKQNHFEVSSEALFASAMRDAKKNGVGMAARNFHVRLAQAFTHMATLVAKEYGTSLIALSGGVMQNNTLKALLTYMFKEKGLTVLSPKTLPSNDGGISLGQAYYGYLYLREQGTPSP